MPEWPKDWSPRGAWNTSRSLPLAWEPLTVAGWDSWLMWHSRVGLAAHVAWQASHLVQWGGACSSHGSQVLRGSRGVWEVQRAHMAWQGLWLMWCGGAHGLPGEVELVVGVAWWLLAASYSRMEGLGSHWHGGSESHMISCTGPRVYIIKDQSL